MWPAACRTRCDARRYSTVSAKERHPAGCLSYFVNPRRSRTPQGKECVQGKPSSGFPCAFNQRPPQAALIFAPQKSAVPSLAPNNKTTPKGVVLVVRQFRCRYSRIPQGRGSVRGKPLRVSPLAFDHPPAGDHFCTAKVPHQQKETHKRVSLFVGASDGT